MTKLSDTCPVCGMAEEAGVPSLEYHKMYFHFCSEQCRKMFIAHPKLYRSMVGKERKEIIKRRTILLAKPLDTEVSERVVSYLKGMMGVKEVMIESDKVYIDYDLLQVTEKQIEKALIEMGEQLGSGWLNNLRRGWVHNSEKNELDNLAASVNCCNRKPSGS